MDMWFTGSCESVVIFSPITPNVNFVDTYKLCFQNFRNIRHKIIFLTIQLYILQVCCACMNNLTLIYVKIINISILLNSNKWYNNIELNSSVTLSPDFLWALYCKQHAQCNIAARWVGFMHI